MPDSPSSPNNSQAHAEPLLRRSASSSRQSRQLRRSHDRLRGGHSTHSSQETSQGPPRRREMSPHSSERAWRKRSPTLNSDVDIAMDTKPSWESHRRSSRSSPSTSNEIDRTKAGLLDGMGDDDDDEESGLKYEHRNRRRRKRGNTFPLGEIPLGHLTPTQEKKIADLAVIKSSLVNVTLIVLWYIFSLSISLVGCYFSIRHLIALAVFKDKAIHTKNLRSVVGWREPNFLPPIGCLCLYLMNY